MVKLDVVRGGFLGVDPDCIGDNEGNGFSLAGNYNRVYGNTAGKNIDDGFVVGEDGRGNILDHNQSSENGDGDPADGFEIRGSDNLIKSNNADHNWERGIYLTATARTNTVTDNAASRSALVDLADDNAGCSSNGWTQNIFGTKSRACIR